MPFDSTLGAALIGGFIATMSYGIMSLQSYNFFQRYSREKIVLKYTVRALWALHTLHSALVTNGLYTIFVTGFGNLASAAVSPWSIAASSLLNAIMILTVQWYGLTYAIALALTDFVFRSSYCHRIWKFVHCLDDICIRVGVRDQAVRISGSARDDPHAYKQDRFILPSFAAYKSTEWMLAVTLVCACLTDLYIALWLCWWLVRQRKGLNDRTSSMINNIIVYTVATGLITSVFSLTELITAATLPNSYVFIGIDFFLGGVYTNSLMAS
ncbi:uncharacterized protein PHACADRAFT_195192 [Phanerochaete carnosa HHB-10118-sp]|uniref:DUF6534 domain-containing protein n=1 Tax=Phanerochaete carnosa (strain HHB-10118-sp) TaxID=650164 RepID=K5W7L4_PHACS|nr:uncharacterized protein PHACADRAFT_195192 [Phanerochaete carnosa HHB-10118-sp]EKM55165.1 hypothetical protein PHACADRAFT_195192 [Phanerochaete carnosa HHB-10118-sp]